MQRQLPGPRAGQVGGCRLLGGFWPPSRLNCGGHPQSPQPCGNLRVDAHLSREQLGVIMWGPEGPSRIQEDSRLRCSLPAAYGC